MRRAVARRTNLNGLTARAARHRDGKRDTCAINLRFGVTNRSLSRWVAVLQLAADQSEYAASILSRRARLLPGLMWDLDNTPLSGRNCADSPLRTIAPGFSAWASLPHLSGRVPRSLASAPARRGMVVATCSLSGLLQNARLRVLGGGNRQPRAASRPKSGEDLPRRRPIRMLRGDHFREDPILQQHALWVECHINLIFKGAAGRDPRPLCPDYPKNTKGEWHRQAKRQPLLIRRRRQHEQLRIRSPERPRAPNASPTPPRTPRSARKSGPPTARSRTGARSAAPNDR